jgi:very-short-patch-repair endonuclease
MDVAALVAQHGGSCSWAQLRAVASKRRIRAAVRAGEVTRVARGRYVLPSLADARRAAVRLQATVSHTSAALHWGWSVKLDPTAPHLTFPRGRKLREGARDGIRRHWRTLSADEVIDGWVTSPIRTVIDCCLDLPFDEALAVADSSWRNGLSPVEVAKAAQRLPQRSWRKVRAVLRYVDRRAANPFESVLRAICLRTDGLNPVPQYEIKDGTFYAKVDLADVELRIVIEAESFEHHGTRSALRRDCRRYTGLGARLWAVLRFTWEEVMFEPEQVAAALRLAVDARRRTATTGRRRGG